MRLAAAAILVAVTMAPSWAQGPAAPPLDLFFAAAAADERTARAAMDRLAALWRDSYTAMIVDMARQLRLAPRVAAPAGADLPGSPTNPADRDSDDGAFLADAFAAAPAPRQTRESLIRLRLLAFLEKQTGKRFDPLLRGWREWMWTLPYEPLDKMLWHRGNRRRGA